MATLRQPPIHRIKATLAFGALLALAGCQTTGDEASGRKPGPSNFAEMVADATTTLTKPARQGAYGAVSGGSPAGAGGQVYAGSGMEMSSTGRQGGPGGEGRVADASGRILPGGYQLNFENADVGVVCKAVLGDVLHANYFIDPRVTGQINLTSSQPVANKNLLPLLERALATIGAAVVKDSDLYRIVPGSDAGGVGAVDYHAAGEGFGATVIAAKFVAPGNLAKLLEGLGSKAGSVRVDQAMGVIVVQGAAAERRAALEAAEMIDVDWMRSKSVAILPVAGGSADAIVADLNRILDTGEGGLSQNIVQLQPMGRLNAVLAVSRNKEAVDLVAKWVQRLERVDQAANGVKVYRLQFAQAKNVAQMLREMFNESNPTDSAPAGDTAGKPAAGANPGASGASASNGGSGGSPFGGLAVKAAFADAAKNARASDAQPASATGSGDAKGGPRISFDAGSNALFIVASARDYRSIESAIRLMDRPPVQVNISATIAEVTLTSDLQYGVQAYLQSSSVGGSFLNGTNATANANGTTIPIGSVNPGFNVLFGNAANPRVIINALQSMTTVKVLSSPSLVVSDRQAAVLQVGNQVPVLTSTAQGITTATSAVVNNVDYRDTGIILNVLPRVNANGVVSMDIEQQISAVVDQNPTLTPTVSQRRVRSSVSVENGQTVMLAGLISDQITTTKNGLPFLSNIQYIGDVIGNKDNNVQRTELLIFIRPQIITNGADAASVTEEFRNRMQSLRRVNAVNVKF